MDLAQDEIFALEVQTNPLNAALRFLCKTERKPGWLILSFADGTLRLTLGRTRRDVAASGKWPHSARVDRTWAVTLSNRPYAPPVTALQFHSGKLHARDFAVMCALEPSSEAEGDILDVWRVLARYGVTTDTVKALLASERSAPLGDERLLRDVMTVWKQVARFGVEPLDVRALLMEKSRNLWAVGPRTGRSPMERYSIADSDLLGLVDRADPAKAAFWKSAGGEMIHDIADVWPQVARYGLGATDVLRLIAKTTAKSA